MQIGEVIRKYRKEKNFTQEELANRLGVSAPAVNKWERGTSQPDIMLLAPLARLLEISLETLLSFHETLTTEEIAAIINEVDKRFAEHDFDNVFQYALGIIQQYPNCNQLIWQLAVVFNARIITDKSICQEKYEPQILKWFHQALEGGEENLRRYAADSLFAYYLRKENYKEAEQYIAYFAEDSAERKRKQALIYSKTGRREQAYQVYEEILFSSCQMLNIVFYSLYQLALEEKDLPQAEMWIEKERCLANLFEMGVYQEEICLLEFSAYQKDVEKTIFLAKRLLEAVDKMGEFVKSKMYRHMNFREINETFRVQQKENLQKLFREKETFGYMEGNPQWEALIG